MLNAIGEALAERSAQGQAVARLAARQAVELQGLSGSQLAAVLSQIRASVGRPLAVVLPADVDLEATLLDVRTFHGRRSDHGAVVAFPPLEINPYGPVPAHDDIVRERLQTLDRCLRGRVDMMIAPVRCWTDRLPQPARFREQSLRLAAGDAMAPERLVEALVSAGYRRTSLVEELGEFAVRGGIVDVFPPTREHPARIEFFGDEIESLREFNPRDQRSMRTVEGIDLPPAISRAADGSGGELGGEPPLQASLADYLEDPLWVEIEPEVLQRNGEKWNEYLDEHYHQALAAGEDARVPDELVHPVAHGLRRDGGATHRLTTTALVRGGQGALSLLAQAAPVFRGRLADLAAELERDLAAGERVVFMLGRRGKAERLAEILEGYGITASLVLDPADAPRRLEPGRCWIGCGDLSAGFRVPELRLWIGSDAEIFGRARPPARRRRFHGDAFQGDFRDLQPGDHLIHEEHGVGRFVGVKKIDVDGVSKEFMELSYRDADRLYLPLDQLYQVQKFRAGEASKPRIDKLGGTNWAKVKGRVKKELRDMAADLLALYAARKSARGHGFGADSAWQRELEDSFEYDETPDQLSAIAEVKADMESTTVMDRLLCGDVGYGKTEVAMRAAFKAVLDGKQVAFLAPTTVLAHQHWRTLTQRFSAFPVQVELMSRFRSHAELRSATQRLGAGTADIVVGTHRLLSKDVQFKDLGLLIVDEEQRFGVGHKERLKKLKTEVDVLALSATPIPRTLQMSLLGVRDLSVIETPPKDRYAIATHIIGWDTDTIANAIHEELGRGGQVFFVHNRIESIYRVARALEELVPEASYRVAHGQLPKSELEGVMLDFVDGAVDVLVTTTIVENGLDIPRANTIVINRAHRFGLAQLYQLRGRVGRSTHRAYAYLIVPPIDTLDTVAKKRLQAIQEFSDLGSGFRLAAMDLEIRGAGSMLGERQHGHIAAVGFELYARLLEEAVHEIKGDPAPTRTRAQLNLGLDLQLPDQYVVDPVQRLMISKRLASARSEAQLEALLAELRDRYGPLPAAVERLFAYSTLRLIAESRGVLSIDRHGAKVAFRLSSDAPIELPELLAQVQAREQWSLTPPDRLTVETGVLPAPDLIAAVTAVIEALG